MRAPPSRADRDPATPPDVEVTAQARPPTGDPTLGIPVARRALGTPRHRLVTVGDSLTHGFKSLAVCDTTLSYPALLARALGWQAGFRVPAYEGFGGVPLNLEWLLRELERRFGDAVDVFESVGAFLTARRALDRLEDHWERGAGSRIERLPWVLHNLSVYGWDLRDALFVDAEVLHRRLRTPTDEWLSVVPENVDAIAGLRVLDSARNHAGRALTALEAAAQLGAEGAVEPDVAEGDGIETLIVFLGANNALASVLSLTVSWSGPDFADPAAKGRYSVWRPEHFAAELAEVAAAVRRVRARHVLWGTVPHVTIAPLAKGIGGKASEGSRFFRYYVRPWLDEDAFLAHPRRFPHLTAAQARAIDSAIDQYNESIVAAVRDARRDGLDWRVVDVAGVLDRLAQRRYVEDPGARPAWWEPYELPGELPELLGFEPTTRFLRSGPRGVTQGGLVSLDGIHPTTVGYGILAHEFLQVMRGTGVQLREQEIDWRWVVEHDTLLTTPLRSLGASLDVLGWLDDRLGLIARAERAMRFRNP